MTARIFIDSNKPRRRVDCQPSSQTSLTRICQYRARMRTNRSRNRRPHTEPLHRRIKARFGRYGGSISRNGHMELSRRHPRSFEETRRHRSAAIQRRPGRAGLDIGWPHCHRWTSIPDERLAFQTPYVRVSI